MRKMLESRTFFFVLGALIFGSISAVLAYDYVSSSFSFTPDDEEWPVENVTEALDDLYSVTNTCEFGCPYEHDSVVYTSNYIGEQDTFTPLCSGTYKIEVWGAQGGDASCDSRPGGYGGYSVVYANINVGTPLFINVGGKGNTATNNNSPVDGGYNGGGKGRISDGLGSQGECSGSGGGATSVALNSGTLNTLSEHIEDGKILVVAGGGGGSSYYHSMGSYRCYGSGGHGGGVNGVDAYDWAKNSCNAVASSGGYGGMQVADTRTATYMGPGSFGQGGWLDNFGQSGGGGGFYGGYSSGALGSGGGSGYIGSQLLVQNISNNILNKMFCYDCLESSELRTYTVSTHGTSTHTAERNESCTSGYDSFPISGCAKAGNGYIRITYTSLN